MHGATIKIKKKTSGYYLGGATPSLAYSALTLRYLGDTTRHRSARARARTHTHTHTHKSDMSPLNERSARRRGHNIHNTL
jgi:hypothetical protein